MHFIFLLLYIASHLQLGKTALLWASPILAYDMTDFIARVWHTTPIHRASYEDDIESLGALLESISDHSALSICNPFGWTPLHVSVYLKRVDVVRLLLVKGADPFLMTDRGHTALHLACYRGSIDIVRLLIRTAVYDR